MESNEVWCIAYIRKKFIEQIPEDLTLHGLTDIEVYVPTVKVFKKLFKGRSQFDDVPLLFNYGFFKLPYHKACRVQYLAELRNQITAIHGWVKDPIKRIENLIKNKEESEFRLSLLEVATASDKEIANLVRSSNNNSIFNKDVIERITPGDKVFLSGYPFDDLPAEIISINHKLQTIKVKLLIENGMGELSVGFDNVFYTVYNAYSNNEAENISIDELRDTGSKLLDKIYAKVSYDYNDDGDEY